MLNFESLRYACLCVVFLTVIGLMPGCSVKSPLVQKDGNVVPVLPVSTKDTVEWPDKELPDRFQKYWNFRKAGDADSAFNLEAAHVREMVIRGRYESFFNKNHKNWESIKIEKIKNVTKQLVEIDFNIFSNVTKEQNNKVFYRDNWLYFGGQWVHVLKDPMVTGDGLKK